MREDLTISDVKKRAVKSVKWTVFTELAGRAIQPIITLILARLLTPEDFGLIGMSMVVISLTVIFQNFGLDKALIQREGEIEKSANVAFWANLIFALILYVFIFSCAPLIADFFHEPKAAPVLRVLCIRIVLLSLVSVHQALFQRLLQFKELFYIRLFSAITPAFVSIPLAVHGYGVWALVYGSLAGAIIQVFIFFRFTTWRPQFSYDFELARQLFGFGSWAALETFLGWLLQWGDSVILGHYFGAKELGVYRVGIMLVILIFSFTCGSISTVAYSAFSRLQMDPSELKRYFLKTVLLTAGIALPIGVSLFLLAQPIGGALLGQKWHGIEKVIAIIGMSEAIAWLVGMNPHIYRAMGRPDVNSKLLIINIAYFIPVYALVAPQGLLVFCIARLACTVISIPMHLYVSYRLLELSPVYLWECAKRPLTIALIMALVIFSILKISYTYLQQGWFLSVVVSVFSLSLYLFALWMMDRQLMKRTISLIREAL